MIASDAGRRWYVAQTQPHRDALAASQLQRQGFETFQPSCERTIRHGRQFRTRREPLFARYLFVAFDPRKDRWRSINGTLGISRLLTAGDDPQPVPSGIVEVLRDSSTGHQPPVNLQVGQPVRLTSGPFAGLMGLLIRLDQGGRVEVLLRMMGGDIPLLTDATALVPAA